VYIANKIEENKIDDEDDKTFRILDLIRANIIVERAENLK